MIRSVVFRSLVFGLMFGSAPSFAQDLSVEDIISLQLEAFNARDVDAAWQFASPMIQGIFRSPDNFGRMVQNGYPMVWDNSDVRFLEQQERGEGVRQQVLIKGPDGALYVLDYQMIRTGNEWQINGVQVLPAPEFLS